MFSQSRFHTRPVLNDSTPQIEPANRAIADVPSHIMKMMMTKMSYSSSSAFANTCSTLMQIRKDVRAQLEGPTHDYARLIKTHEDEFVLAICHNDSEPLQNVPAQRWQQCMRNGVLKNFDIRLYWGLPHQYLEEHNIFCFKRIERISFSGYAIDQQIIDVFESKSEGYSIQVNTWPKYINLLLTTKFERLEVTGELRGFGCILDVVRCCPKISVRMTLQGLENSCTSLNALGDKSVKIQDWWISFFPASHNFSVVFTRLKAIICRIASNNVQIRFIKDESIITVKGIKRPRPTMRWL